MLLDEPIKTNVGHSNFVCTSSSLEEEPKGCRLCTFEKSVVFKQNCANDFLL